MSVFHNFKILNRSRKNHNVLTKNFQKKKNFFFDFLFLTSRDENQCQILYVSRFCSLIEPFVFCTYISIFLYYRRLVTKSMIQVQTFRMYSNLQDFVLYPKFKVCFESTYSLLSCTRDTKNYFNQLNPWTWTNLTLVFISWSKK